MQHFSVDATIFSNFFKNHFLPTTSWKNHPQKLLRKTQIHFFFLIALSCPNGPNRRIHVPKYGLCLIDQLYIELGAPTRDKRIDKTDIQFWAVLGCREKKTQNRHNHATCFFFNFMWAKEKYCRVCTKNLHSIKAKKFFKNMGKYLFYLELK